MEASSISRYSKAVEYATIAHARQVRKSTGGPMIVHPYSVSMILLHHGYPIDLAIAGLLHDVVEDCKGYTIVDIEKEFGKDVANYVLNVTEVDKSLSWKQRKDAYIEHIKYADEYSRALCAADKIHNLLSLYTDMKEQGLSIFDKFNATQDETVWYYRTVCYAITKDGTEPAPIFKEYEKILNLFLDELCEKLLNLNE